MCVCVCVWWARAVSKSRHVCLIHVCGEEDVRYCPIEVARRSLLSVLSHRSGTFVGGRCNETSGSIYKSGTVCGDRFTHMAGRKSTTMMDTAVTAAIAVQEDNNNTTCGNCDSEVKEENHAVACDICDLWFHIGCQDMPKEVYDFMVNTEEGQLHWYCVNCKRGSAKLQR